MFSDRYSSCHDMKMPDIFEKMHCSYHDHDFCFFMFVIVRNTRFPVMKTNT